MALVLALAGGAARTETAMVRVGPPLPRMGLLKAGSHRYLRYQVKDGKRTARDIWDRTVSFEARDGRRLLHITQRWDEVNVAPGATSTLEQDSWFEPQSFRPLTHIRRVTVGSEVKVAGYAFLADKVVGLADLAGNTRKDFSISYGETPFNFEYDMELIQTLPLHQGYEANIIFYDAGVDPKADRYTFKVAGSERISGWDGRPMDCWLITADYNTGAVQSRWWVEKASQVVLREESSQADGSILVKTLLPPEAADARRSATDA
jgi:hypothetical protein